MPAYVINSRVTHFMGPLTADDGDVPRFAQLYVFDEQMGGRVESNPPRVSAHATAFHEYLTTSRRERTTRNSVVALVNLVDRLVAMLYRVRACYSASNLHPLSVCSMSVAVSYADRPSFRRSTRTRRTF